MKTLEAIKKYPGWAALVATIVLIGGGITAMDTLTRWWGSHEIAYAGQMTAEENRVWIQKQETINETIAKVLTQKQAPDQDAMIFPEIWIDEDGDGTCWVCQAYDYADCWDDKLWERCDDNGR